MVREDIVKEVEGLCVKRDELMRNLGIVEGALQVWQHMLSQAETAAVSTEAVEGEVVK